VRYLGLRWKISGVLIISNLVLGLLIIIIVNNKVTESLEKELIERGRTIAINLANYSAAQIMAKDVIGLRQIISGDMAFESVGYILIQDSEGTILADNFNGQVPKELTSINVIGLENYNVPNSISLQDPIGNCYDIIAPVEEGFLGYVRVGMKIDYVNEAVRRTNMIIIFTIIGITLAGMAIVLFLANRIIKPILYLTRRADDLSQGKLDEKVGVNTNDEIQNLGEALERLRESVKIALERLKKHQTLRI
jgi:HAMP domain-containing protein